MEVDGRGAPVRVDPEPAARALAQLARATARFGGHESVALEVDGAELALSPLSRAARPVVLGRGCEGARSAGGRAPPPRARRRARGPRGDSRHTPAYTEQPREPPVLEHPPARLALGAVEDRVLLEVDAGDGSAAVRARLAQAVVDLVRLLVGRTRQAEFQAGGEELADSRREELDLLVAELRRERVGRELRPVQDLVRPGAADAGERPLVAQERMQPARLAAGDLGELGGGDPIRFRAEVRDLGFEVVRPVEADPCPLLRAALGQDQLAAVLEAEPERGRLRALRPGSRKRMRPALIKWTWRTSSPSSVGKRRCLPRRLAPSGVGLRAPRAAGRTSSALRRARARPSPPATAQAVRREPAGPLPPRETRE